MNSIDQDTIRVKRQTQQVGIQSESRDKHNISVYDQSQEATQHIGIRLETKDNSTNTDRDTIKDQKSNVTNRSGYNQKVNVTNRSGYDRKANTTT